MHLLSVWNNAKFNIFKLKFVQDPSTYDERQLKKVLNSKPENQPEHRILVKFRELVDDAKEGKQLKLNLNFFSFSYKIIYT